MTGPALADPEIAAATFQAHLDSLFARTRPQKLGWRRIDLDEMHVVVGLPATRPDGQRDDYYVRLGAEYYDEWPPTTAFVVPETWTEAAAESRWSPTIGPVPWLALHHGYAYPPQYAVDGQQNRQLVCFSGTAEYYMVNHSPTETQQWKRGPRTLAMTLYRLQEVLSDHYIAPSGDA
jgi:hypothetical protein